MSPPTGTSVKGLGRNAPLPADHYSPKSCANCHGSASPSLDQDFFAHNPQHLPYLPSPSDCSAEIYWPESLKTYRAFVQQNTFLRSQNYLETLLASRQGMFPLEVTDTSLGVYLGMKSGSDLPKLPKVPDLALGADSMVCTGSLQSGVVGPEACQSLQLEWQNGDALLPLEGLELLSAKDLEISAKGILGLLPGVQAQGVTIRQGKLLLSAKATNRFWNASLPLALPLPGVKISPNPLDPTLYDADLTPLVLKKLPVAYHPEKREAISYETYLAAPVKSHWKVLPYFLNIARSGRLPDKLAMNEVYAAVSELRANTDPPKKEENPEQRAILEKLLDKLTVSAQLHPRRLLSKNLFVEFSQELNPQGTSNLFRTKFTLSQLKDWEVEASAPVRINRLFSPGLIDLVNLKADLGVYLHRQNTSSVGLEKLDIELGQLEYLRTDADKPGLFATLGGNIRSLEELDNNFLLHRPAIMVRGDANGADLELNLRLDAVSLRLPTIGKVTISGDLHGQVRLVPKTDIEILPNGDKREVKRWVIEPHSLNLKLSGLDLKTEGGIHWQDAELEISDQINGPVPLADSGYLALNFRFPKIEGGHFRSFTIEGGLALAKGVDGLYDMDATLQSVNTQFTLKALKHDGLNEDWVLKLDGSHFPESSVFGATLKSAQTDAAGKVRRSPVDNLFFKFDRETRPGHTYYGFHLGADRLDFDHLDLSKVKVDLGLHKEEPQAGVVRWTVPELNINANGSGWSKKGLIRGPIWLTSKAPAKNPLSIEIDKNTKTLDLKNLNLSFGVTGLTDPKLARSTGGRIIGIDLDGRLNGRWNMNYETFKGKGNLALSGDGQGDIHLRGVDGMPLSKPHPDDPDLLVGTPVLSNTKWEVRRTDGIDFDNQWIKGNFHLSTLIDPAVARVFGIIFDNNLVLSWQFNHDHLPYTAAGFSKKVDQYLAKKRWDEKSESKPKEEPKP